jgi:hypothetical protein
MPEIDLRQNPWNWGIPRDDTFVDRELYRLVTIFAASSFLSEQRGDNDEANLFGYCLRYFELPEVGQILISLAAILRNDWEHRPESIDEHLSIVAQDPKVGTLIEDLANPTSQCDLHVRDSLHKIIHAHTMNLLMAGDSGQKMVIGLITTSNLGECENGKNTKTMGLLPSACFVRSGCNQEAGHG